MVWAALSSSGIIRLIISDDNIIAATYLQMIEIECYPQMMALNNSSQIYFQQGGAPPYWLNDNLPN